VTGVDSAESSRLWRRFALPRWRFESVLQQIAAPNRTDRRRVIDIVAISRR
jgi:hypothetical protein